MAILKKLTNKILGRKDLTLDTVEEVKQIEEPMKKYRSQFVEDWRTYEDFYHNHQHLTGVNAKTKKNMIFTVIESSVSEMTEGLPGVVVESEDIPDEQMGSVEDERAEILKNGIQHVLQEQKFQLKLGNILRQSGITGAGWVHAYYDYGFNGGKGEIRLDFENWRNILVDGNGSTMEDAEGAQVKKRRSLGRLKEMYPLKAAELCELEGTEDQDNYDNENTGDLWRSDRDVSGRGLGKIGELGRPKEISQPNIFWWKQTWQRSYEKRPIDIEVTTKDIEKETLQLASGQPPEIKLEEDHRAHGEAHYRQRELVLQSVGVEGGKNTEITMAMLDQKVQGVQMAAEQGQIEEQTAISLIKAITDAATVVRMIDGHIKEHEELQKENPFGLENKYPSGWRVIETVRSIKLFDGDSWDLRGGKEGLFYGPPLVPFYCYKDETIWGFGEVKNIFNAQTSMNEMDTKEYQAIKKSVNTKIRAQPGVGLTREDFTNEEGLIIFAEQGHVEQLAPMIVSPAFATRRESDRQYIERATAQFEQAQGGTSHTLAGVAIQRLQMSAGKRTRMKVREMEEYSLKRLGLLIADLIMGHWTEEKVFSVTTPEGAQKFLFDPLQFEDFRYRVRTDADSMVGRDPDALNEFYFALLDKNRIDMKMFLELADVPKKSKILKMIQDQEEQAQQVAQQQQGQADQGQQQLLQASEQLRALSIELLKYKARFTPELLTPEDEKLIQEEDAKEAENAILSGQAPSEEEAMAMQEGNVA